MVAILEEKLKRIRKEERETLSKIDRRNKKRAIKCQSCTTTHRIADIILIQTHFYVQPHGCTGGDYWLPGEIQFVCPQTNMVNRLLFDNDNVPWEKRENYENDPQQQFKRTYGHLFREVVDVNKGEESERKWVNNYYLDNHREEFGLVAKRKRD
ncbi:hypothetical protein COU53_00425 [Candidatus Pacearchaeota archaeon CG10_big_fil_rev_8_21_14_0_10_30_48]|nr:MAG: hypothetical protein COU53_00425 [Candidatus Pacearchaeota archaeon CG10_big_fil_rev_8_21_14_0_10_30_48]